MVDGIIKKELVPCKELKLSATQVHYKKLMAYLLLLYRSYLQEETTLEPEIKMALWRMVQLQEAFSLKIQMAQSAYEGYEDRKLEGGWNEMKDILFPKEEKDLGKNIDSEQENTIQEYKEAVLELIQRV